MTTDTQLARATAESIVATAIRKTTVLAYDVKDGYIQDRGKFETEPIYSPYYYHLMLDGSGNLLPDDSTAFEVTNEERLAFPELYNAKVVVITEDGQGFITAFTYDSKEFAIYAHTPDDDREQFDWENENDVW